MSSLPPVNLTVTVSATGQNQLSAVANELRAIASAAKEATEALSGLNGVSLKNFASGVKEAAASARSMGAASTRTARRSSSSARSSISSEERAAARAAQMMGPQLSRYDQLRNRAGLALQRYGESQPRATGLGGAITNAASKYGPKLGAAAGKLYANAAGSSNPAVARATQALTAMAARLGPVGAAAGALAGALRSNQAANQQAASAVRQQAGAAQQAARANQQAARQPRGGGGGGRGGVGIGGIAAGSALGGLMMEGAEAAIQGMYQGIIGFNAQMEQSKVAWTSFLKSADAANVQMARLNTIAQKTPYAFADVNKAVQGLVGKGFGAEEAVTMFGAIGDVAAGLGLGAEGVDRISLALAQMQSKGKVSAEEMRQLNEATVNAWAALSEYTGKGTGELMRMVEANQISSDTMMAAFKAYSTKNFGGMMEKQSMTFNGAVTKMGDNLTQLAAQMGGPIFDAVKNIMAQLVQATVPWKQAWVGDVQTIVANVVNALTGLNPAIYTGIAAFAALTAVVLMAGPAWAALGAIFVFLTSPIGLIIIAIAALVVAFQTNFLGITDAVVGAWPVIENALFEIAGGIYAAFEPALTWIQEAVPVALNAVAQFWQENSQTILDIVLELWNVVAAQFELAFAVVAGIVEIGMAIVAGNWDDAWNAVKKTVFLIWKGITKTILNASNAVINIIKALANAVGAQGVAAALTEIQAGLDDFADDTVTATSNVLGLNDAMAKNEKRLKDGASTTRRFTATVQNWFKALASGKGSSVTTQDLAKEKAEMRAYDKAIRDSKGTKSDLVAPGGGGGGGGGGKDQARNLQDVIKALIEQAPAYIQAAKAVKYYEDAIAGLEAQIKANDLAIKNAQRVQEQMEEVLDAMKQKLQDLEDELDRAKTKLEEFANPRLKGQGKLEDQIFAIEQQLKRVQLAKQMGKPLSEIMAMYPILNKGMRGFIASLPQTEEGLQKMLDQLGLAQSLSFDEKLRELAKAAQGAVKEMSYGEALAGIQQQQAEIARLEEAIVKQTAAVTAQQAAVDAQARSIKDMQRANEDLNMTLDIYKEKLKIAQENQKAVEAGLTNIYTWFLKDREEMLKTGQLTQEQAVKIDEAARDMLLKFDAFSTSSIATLNDDIQEAVKVYESQVNAILASLAKLPESHTTTLYVNTVRDGVVTASETAGGSVITTGGFGPSGMATGGPVISGTTYLVGERGPELFTPHRSGNIIPNHALGGTTVVVNVSGSVVTHNDLIRDIRNGLRQTGRVNAQVTP